MRPPRRRTTAAVLPPPSPPCIFLIPISAHPSLALLGILAPLQIAFLALSHLSMLSRMTDFAYIIRLLSVYTFCT
ncbi:hypothetical protein B0H12DRAFT_1152680 [Mycena haematopus]|nr:hypothetical protein B0H12DRAFT_1152680 [Mycena haematopus]